MAAPSDRRKIESILREPLTRHRLMLNSKLRAAQAEENPTPFTFEDLKAFMGAIRSADPNYQKETLNALEAVATGKAPQEPRFDTPETQLIWGASLAFLSANHDQMKTWLKPPAEGVALPQTELWKQVSTTDFAYGELLSHAHHIREALRDKDTKYGWGEPGTGFTFDRAKNLINVDFMQSMIVGFEHARADVYREIGHSLLSVTYPKRMKEVFKEMQPLMKKSRLAQAKKGPKLKPDEYKKLTMLSTEWQLRHMLFTAAEENVANRFVSNMGSQLLQDFGVSLNNTAVTHRGVGLTRLPNDGMSEELKRYMNLCNTVQLSFFANNALFDNTEAGWAKVGIDPSLVRKTATLNARPAGQKEDTDGINHPDFQHLRELAGGPKGLENLQPKQHERLFGWANLKNRVERADADRKEIIEEIWRDYAEDLIQKILKMANDQIDENLDKAQKDPKNQKDKKKQDGKDLDQNQDDQDGDDQDGDDGQDGQDGQEGDDGQEGQGQGKGKGKGKGKPQKGKKQRGKPQGEQDDADSDDADGDDADGQEGKDGQKKEGKDKDGKKGDKKGDKKEKGKKGEKGEDGEEQDGDGEDGEGQDADGEEQDGDSQGKQKGKGKEGKLGQDDEDTVPVEGAGDQPAPKGSTELPSDELDPNGEGKDADGEGQDADGEGQDADGEDADGEDADGDDGMTADELEKELDKRKQKGEEGDDADGQDGQDGQDGEGKGKPGKGKPGKPSKQAGHGDGKSLEELAKLDWTDYQKRIAELAGPITRVRKLFKDVQERQLQRKRAVSSSLEILPENGEVKDRFNVEAHRNLTIKRKTGDVEENDLKRFHSDQVKMVPTEVDIVIMIDGSGSMNGTALNSALQAAAIMFEAASGKDMKMNVYVGMWGDANPPMLITPGADRVEIGKQMARAQKGLNSGTDLAPAIKKVAKTIGEQRGKSGTLSGFTHVLIISDGDMFDPAPSTERIMTMFEYSDKITFDTAIIGRPGTSMETMAKKIKGHKNYQDVGVTLGSNPNEIPMAIVGLLLEKVKKTGSFVAIPNSQKRRAMNRAHNKMDRKP